MQLFFALLLVIVTLFGYIGTHKAFAVSANDISVDVSPNNPQPHVNTTISISSYLANLDSVMITWSLDGKIVASGSGIGRKTFSFDSGAQGAATRVDVSISLPDGIINKRVTVTPAVMVMLWEATDSYVPPFYKGKALLSEGSEVKVVALPEIKVGVSTVSPKNMTYSWKKDYANDQNASGFGKNAFTFTTDYLENTSTISVVASTLDQKYNTEGSMSTTTTIPEIAFYRKDPILGTEREATVADGHHITSADGTETIVAVPYYISPRALNNPALVFTWHINDQMIAVDNFSKNIMPLKVEGGVSGSSKLRLDIDNSDKIFQTAMKQITINF